GMPTGRVLIGTLEKRHDPFQPICFSAGGECVRHHFGHPHHHCLARYSPETARSYHLPGTGLRAVPEDDCSQSSRPDGADCAERDADGLALHPRPDERRQRADRDDRRRRPRLANRRPLRGPRLHGLRGDPDLQSLGHAGKHAGATGPDHPGPHRRDLAGPSAWPLFQHRAGVDLSHPRPLADRGRIISNNDGAYLVMLDGHVHRYEVKDPSKGVQIVAFDQYVLNISDFSAKDTSSKELRPRERYLNELLNPDPNLLKNKGASGQLRTELHDRFSTPFYPLLFAFLAVAVLGHARTTRESRWAQILVAAGIAVGLRVSGLTASNLVTLSAGATPLVYVIPIGAIIVAALVAHVRMSPELRSKLSLQLKFVPDNIKFWTGRGIVAK